jgi:hypothetical protein
MFIGIILFEIIIPAKRLSTSSHLMEFISCWLFSLMLIYGENWGCPRSVKKIIRVLYTAVREVAMSIINRAQALVLCCIGGFNDEVFRVKSC